jgi:hypothetical protein
MLGSADSVYATMRLRHSDIPKQDHSVSSVQALFKEILAINTGITQLQKEYSTHIVNHRNCETI